MTGTLGYCCGERASHHGLWPHLKSSQDGHHRASEGGGAQPGTVAQELPRWDLWSRPLAQRPARCSACQSSALPVSCYKPSAHDTLQVAPLSWDKQAVLVHRASSDMGVGQILATRNRTGFRVLGMEPGIHFGHPF